jgi:ATP-dependent Zn protease
MGRLRNIALWVVIALLLVFLFNLFQGTHPRGNASPPPAAPNPMPDLLAIFINWFPMLLIFGVWLFFLRQMKARQGNNDDKSNKF